MTGRFERGRGTDARRTARHLMEGWAIEAAQQRRLADEYRDHVVWLAAELRARQSAAGIVAHDCPICRNAVTALEPATGAEGGTR